MTIKEAFTYSDTSRVLFCSDLHIGHRNSLYFDNRPFSSIEEMDSYIINLFSELNPTDSLFILGDTFWKLSPDRVLEILKKVPEGVRLYKIFGNHDKRGLFRGEGNKIPEYFELLGESFDIKVNYEGNTYLISLDHFPKVSWNHKPRGAFMVHGHTHGNIDKFNDDSKDLRVDISFSSNLCRKVGTPFVDFPSILSHFREKTNNENFRNWVMRECTEL